MRLLPKKTVEMQTTATAMPNIVSLRTAEQVAADIRMTPERLIGFAEAGYCPHYRVDGGEPLFLINEVRQWAKQNMVQRIDGGDIPWSVQVLALPNHPDVGPPPPLCISTVVNLVRVNTSGPPGVYFLCRAGEVVYVGQSLNPQVRIGKHIDKEFDRAFLLPVPVQHLCAVENAFIRVLGPEYNIYSSGRPIAGGGAPASDKDREIVAEYGMESVA